MDEVLARAGRMTAPGVGAVLATIAGWHAATWREMQGGLSNRTYLVEKPGRRAVLKIDTGPRRPPLSTREAEARIQLRAAAAGIANQVLAARKGCYLTEYVAGEVWSREAIGEAENLRKLAGTLRVLHGLPLTGRTFDALGAARQYADLIQGSDPKMIDDCLGVIESAPPPENLSCCHNDLVAENIIATPAIRLLDWEYACDNDPLFDLATVIAHHELPRELADVLLDAYFDGDEDKRREGLAAQMRLYNALLRLWLEVRRTATAGDASQKS